MSVRSLATLRRLHVVRLHRICHRMRPIAIDVTWSVCLSVCLMDTSASPAKNGWTDRDEVKSFRILSRKPSQTNQLPKQRGFLERRHSNLRSRHERHIVGKEMRYFEQLFAYIQKAKKLKLSDYLRRRPEEMTAVTYLCHRRRKGSVVGGGHHALWAPQLWHQWTVTKHTVFTNWC